MKTYDVVVDENGEIRGVEHETARMPEYLMPRVSLRDYFAAAALTSFIGDTTRWAMSSEELAERAYKVADAMLQERNRD